MKAIVIGATGLVGQAIIKTLIASEHYSRITTLSRSPIGIEHEKLDSVIGDLNDESFLSDVIKGDVLINCLGTTQKRAGSKAAFKAIDYTMALQIANIAIQNNVPYMLHVSSIGAAPRASSFYLSVKGELEQQLQLLPWKSLHIFRPSLLLGNRSETRIAEDISKPLMKLTSPLMFGRLKRYRPIHAEKLAFIMINTPLTGAIGIQIHYPSAYESKH